MGLQERREAAAVRVLKALEHIQRAQDEFDRACMQLSCIQGAAATYDRVRRQREKIRQLWYVVDGKNASQWKLDHEPREGA
jgi:hypothetical protein